MSKTLSPVVLATAELQYRSAPKADRKAGLVKRPVEIPQSIWSLTGAELRAIAGEAASGIVTHVETLAAKAQERKAAKANPAGSFIAPGVWTPNAPTQERPETLGLLAQGLADSQKADNARARRNARRAAETQAKVSEMTVSEAVAWCRARKLPVPNHFAALAKGDFARAARKASA